LNSSNDKLQSLSLHACKGIHYLHIYCVVQTAVIRGRHYIA